MRPGKIFKWVLLLLILLIGSLVVYFYVFPRRAQQILVPEIDLVKKVSVDLKGDTAYTKLNLRLKNKGLFKINIDSLVYEIKFDTLIVLSRSRMLNIVMKAGATDSFEIPVKLPYKRIVERIRQLQARDSVDIVTDIRIVYKTLFGRVSLPQKKTHRIATPRPPEFILDKVEFAGMTGRKFDFKLHLHIINNGSHDLNFSSIRYKITMKDNLKAVGTHPSVIKVDSASTVNIVLPVRVEFTNMFRTAMLILRNKDRVPYNVEISGVVESAGNDKTDLLIRKSGTVELKK